jgi:hypothetical protein
MGRGLSRQPKGFGDDIAKYTAKVDSFNMKGAMKKTLEDGATQWTGKGGEFLIERNGSHDMRIQLMEKASTHPLADSDVALLAFLVEELERSFARCAEERKQLHEVEWSAGGGAPSVLGETETRADFVIGLVRGWLVSRLAIGHGGQLAAQSIHRSKTLHNWMANDSAAYPQFAAYVQAVEHLRAAALRAVIAQ